MRPLSNLRPQLRACRALVSLISLVVVGLASAPYPAIAEVPADKLNSPVWQQLAKRILGDGQIVFDDAVKVTVPSITENQAQVPVMADARAIAGVVKLVVFADLNPIQHVLTLHPGASAASYISFRMKVEQSTPVRAAALTSDGVWHVGGVWLEASGGGCSSPAMARKDADWSETVGITQARVWREIDGMTRVRFRIRHPMDTGLTRNNTPAFFIERIEVSGAGADVLARLELFEPVSEDPTVTLLVRPKPSETSLTLDGRDNNGSVYRSVVPVALSHSAL